MRHYSEFNSSDFTLVYENPNNHQCALVPLKGRSFEKNGITKRTIVECDECGQRWFAHISWSDHIYNRWKPLRWYHFRLRRKIR